MALRIFHPCAFQFRGQDIRVVGNELDGGTSLSGISDPIQVDGGGYWLADFSDGAFGGRDDARRSKTLEWRALNAGLSGGQRIEVEFCDRHHQPVLGFIGSPDDTATPGAAARVVAVVNGQPGGLNATKLDIAITSERALLGGERFGYVHSTWGPRAAEISEVEPIAGGTASEPRFRITFQPPIRGGITAGIALNFDKPSCTMRRQSQPSNATALGIFATAAITMVEDMRTPT